MNKKNCFRKKTILKMKKKFQLSFKRKEIELNVSVWQVKKNVKKELFLLT